MSARIEQMVAAQFAKDIKDHAVLLKHDDGLYRHLHCRRADTVQYWFDVVTSPGLLVINGDMGCFVFARIADMFRFFGAEGINPDYWAEKLQADSGVKRYDPREAEEYARRALEEAVEGREQDVIDDAFHRFEYDVASEAYDEGSFRQAVDDFEVQGVTFSDSWEWDLKTWSVQYLWCCHAIVWAIAQYRAEKAAA
jgi:hypothetical protein